MLDKVSGAKFTQGSKPGVFSDERLTANDLSSKIREILKKSKRGLVKKQILAKYEKRYNRPLKEEVFAAALKNPRIKKISACEVRSRIGARNPPLLADIRGDVTIYYLQESQLTREAFQ